MVTVKQMLENEKRKEAAYELSDEIYSIHEEAKKAKIMIDDIHAEFFNKYDVKNASEASQIRWTYDRYGIYCGIALDYIYNVHKMIEELYKLADKAVSEKIRQREEEHANKEIDGTPEQEQPPKTN